jgi:hypothetical protein
MKEVLFRKKEKVIAGLRKRRALSFWFAMFSFLFLFLEFKGASIKYCA